MKFLARNSGEIIQTKWKLFRHGRSSASSLFEASHPVSPISRNRLDTAPAHAQSGRADNARADCGPRSLLVSPVSPTPYRLTPSHPSHPSQGKFCDCACAGAVSSLLREMSKLQNCIALHRRTTRAYYTHVGNAGVHTPNPYKLTTN